MTGAASLILSRADLIAAFCVGATIFGAALFRLGIETGRNMAYRDAMEAATDGQT